ncbi:MAG: hypothetical protein ABI766_06860 [Gemmatimonadales bacterium]
MRSGFLADGKQGRLPGTRTTVAILATGIDAQTAAASELEGFEVLRYCETAAMLDHLTAGGDVAAIVTEPRDITGLPVSAFIAPLHERMPETPIIIWFRPSPAAFRAMPEALAVGASGCSVRGYDRLSVILSSSLDSACHAGAVPALLHIFRLLIPTELEEFGLICALKASPRLTPTLVADWMRVKERTLRDRLQQASLAPPSVFIDYATAIHAAFLLDEVGCEPEEVVKRMWFGRTRSLSALVRQFSGLPARGLRQHGGFNAMLARAESCLRRADSRREPEEAGFIDRYLSGELSPEERVAFDWWLATAPAGVAEVLEGMRMLLGDRPRSDEDVRLRRLVWMRLRRELGRRFAS